MEFECGTIQTNKRGSCCMRQYRELACGNTFLWLKGYVVLYVEALAWVFAGINIDPWCIFCCFTTLVAATYLSGHAAARPNLHDIH